MCLTPVLSSLNLLQKSSLWLSLNFFRILSFMSNVCNISPLNQGGILFISSMHFSFHIAENQRFQIINSIRLIFINILRGQVFRLYCFAKTFNLKPHYGSHTRNSGMSVFFQFWFGYQIVKWHDLWICLPHYILPILYTSSLLYFLS